MLKNDKATSKKRSLLMKMLLFIGAPAAILFCITAFIVLSNVKQSVIQLTTSQLTAESQSASYQVSNYFLKYTEIAEQLKLNPIVQNYLQNTGLKSSVKEVDGYQEIDQMLKNITNSDSENIIDTWIADTATNHGIDPADGIFDLEIPSRPWYQQLSESKQTIITAPYEDTSTKALTVSMITPIYKDDSTLIGVAGVDITLDHLYDTIKDYKLGNSGFYILTSSDGTLVYYPDESLKNKNITESNMSENIINAIQNKTEGSITYTAMGQTNYGYLSPIGTTGWTITTGMPENEFLGTVHSVQTLVFTIFSIAFIILVVLIVLISRSIIKPLVKLKNAANQIADGDLDVTIGVKSADEVGQISTALSRTVSQLKQYIEYINEISAVLNQIAIGNLNFELYCNYVGEFSKIKASLENIKSTLVETFSEINMSAEQVANGSSQVSNGAQALAQGATEQASSIEELSATIREISTEVNDSAANAADASEKVNEVSTMLKENNNQMQEMIAAMSRISDSSNQISKIIKAIEDIAFQTNILALNAAVEAARAGAAGKGFAVVADEVRNLASKSAAAAKDTTVLIQNSIEEVQGGTKIADATAKALLEIVGRAETVANDVHQISQTSNKQANSINQLMLGIDQISSVIQTNSATAEESAAASEELSGQAYTLKELVAKFKFDNTAEQTQRNGMESYQGNPNDAVPNSQY